MESISDTALSAIADPVRRRIIGMLARGARPAGEIGAEFDISLPATSRHLRVLREAGWVDDERDPGDNRVRVYRLQGERLRDLRRWLEELERYWGCQLEAFGEHARRRAREGKARTSGKPRSRS